MASSGRVPQKRTKTVFSVTSTGSFIGRTEEAVDGAAASASTSTSTTVLSGMASSTSILPTELSSVIRSDGEIMISTSASSNNIASASASTTTPSESCTQLKNIQYKSMLMNGKNLAMLSEGGSSPLVTKTAEADKVQSLLTSEAQVLKEEVPWNRLSKAQKIKLLTDFGYMYSSEHSLSDEDSSQLQTYLRDCLERKKFTRARDVQYNKHSGIIEDIPGLIYTPTSSGISPSMISVTRKFSLKREDSTKNSTLKNLAPRKVRITAASSTNVGIITDHTRGSTSTPAKIE